jgi:hypothetical protein
VPRRSGSPKVLASAVRAAVAETFSAQRMDGICWILQERRSGAEVWRSWSCSSRQLLPQTPYAAR